MPTYQRLDPDNPDDRRTAVGLLRLKGALKRSGVPRKELDKNLLLASWNVREFGAGRVHGPRTREALHYIAEIVSAFDLVAMQEVRSQLGALDDLMALLGKSWKYLLSDVTLGRRGNEERMAFLYDKRKVRFGGFASQVVIPPVERGGKILRPAEQLARTPFMVGFKTAWFKFVVCTAHVYYGRGAPVDPRRKAEIEALAAHLAGRAKDREAWAKNLILLGDFNIFRTTDVTFRAITEAGFVVPKRIQALPSNVPLTKHYDQIAFYAPDVAKKLEVAQAGVVNVFDVIYREDDWRYYQRAMGPKLEEVPPAKQRAHFRHWRTFQLSDHLPMWIELKTDFSGRFLQGVMKGNRGR